MFEQYDLPLDVHQGCFYSRRRHRIDLGKQSE
jgi:hypothetical protein